MATRPEPQSEHCLQLTELIAEETIDRNPIRQILVSRAVVAAEPDDRGQWWALAGDDRLRVFQPGEQYVGWDRSLRSTVRLGRSREPLEVTWLGGRTLTDATAVLRSFGDAFTYAMDDPATGRPGLRRPQLGAVYSVLGYWTTARTDPATVVMPTGTGKTDTMISLLVALPIERLLVVVPSDALREQLARKFETLGVLPQLGL
jgi:hypothetical protein